MRTPNVPNREPSQRVRLPRWMVLILAPVLILLVHVGLPWAISFLSTRHGWAHRRPGRWNLLALLLVKAGTAGILWCESLHLVASPGSIEMERTPRHLLVRGLYRFTRNPMYLSALTIWLGWALFVRQRRCLCRMWSRLGAGDANGGAVGGARTGGPIWRGLSAIQEHGATLVGQDSPLGTNLLPIRWWFLALVSLFGHECSSHEQKTMRYFSVKLQRPPHQEYYPVLLAGASFFASSTIKLQERTSRWSRAELARRMAQDPSLPPISASTLGRWLKQFIWHVGCLSARESH